MNLSQHFTLDELTQSQAAVRNSISNEPPPIAIENLRRVASLLEQVRDVVGGPIAVSSGYRSPALNQAVGGARNSAHVLGLAADIVAPGWTAHKLAVAIRDAGIEFDQLIYEGSWVHIGLSDTAPRRQLLTATFAGGKASYTAGIE